MYIIENDLLQASFTARGAELTSLYSKKNDLDYLWNGDPAFWGKHSPVLFPLVGALKQNTYYLGDKAFTLSRHGFAREKDFSVTSSTGESISFVLLSDESSLLSYPFPFEFHIHYQIKKHSLEIRYEVINTGTGKMLFSLGAHPAFKTPLTADTVYSDYYLQFDQQETLDRWSVSKEGLIEERRIPFLQHQDRIPLSKALFSDDALVFKHPASKTISIRSDKTSHGLELTLDGFPFLGIWAAKDADFVCLEPWCGIADSETSDQQFAHKEGIERLEQGATFNRSLTITLF